MKRARLGFTFIEVLAALTFLGILMPVVVGALTLANRAAVVAERTGIAVQLGENRLNELMLASEWATAEMRGTFGADRPGYRWELGRQQWEAGQMTELTLAVFFPVQGSEHSINLSTLVTEATSQP